jgi:hypothetical protein
MIDFSAAPEDPIERLAWLGGVMDRAQTEVDVQFQRAYFQARQSGRFDSALALRLHSVKRALAFTRAENERTGRQWRWGDKR